MGQQNVQAEEVYFGKSCDVTNVICIMDFQDYEG